MLRTVMFPALLLAGCASQAASEPATSMGHPVELSPGQQIALAHGGSVRYVETTNDSRCRPEHQCIRAGEAIVVFEISNRGEAARRVELRSDAKPPTVPAGDVVVRLVSLSFDTPPRATVQVDPAG